LERRGEGKEKRKSAGGAHIRYFLGCAVVPTAAVAVPPTASLDSKLTHHFGEAASKSLMTGVVAHRLTHLGIPNPDISQCRERLFHIVGGAAQTAKCGPTLLLFLLLRRPNIRAKRQLRPTKL